MKPFDLVEDSMVEKRFHLRPGVPYFRVINHPSARRSNRAGNLKPNPVRVPVHVPAFMIVGHIGQKVCRVKAILNENSHKQRPFKNTRTNMRNLTQVAGVIRGSANL